MLKILFNKTYFVVRSNMANKHEFFDECLSCEGTGTSLINDSLGKYVACLVDFRRYTFVKFH